MLSINYKDGRPIYEQVKEGLRKLITTGAIKEGEKLASEPKAKTYSVPQELWDELHI